MRTSWPGKRAWSAGPAPVRGFGLSHGCGWRRGCRHVRTITAGSDQLMSRDLSGPRRPLRTAAGRPAAEAVQGQCPAGCRHRHSHCRMDLGQEERAVAGRRGARPVGCGQRLSAGQPSGQRHGRVPPGTGRGPRSPPPRSRGRSAEGRSRAAQQPRTGAGPGSDRGSQLESGERLRPAAPWRLSRERTGAAGHCTAPSRSIRRT
jgi:hypothetical protein